MLDQSTKTAKFPLVFSTGTRVSPINIKFTMNISFQTRLLKTNGYHPSPIGCTNSVQEQKLESELSEQLIVITNETQWQKSEQMLVKGDCFNKTVCSTQKDNIYSLQDRLPWFQFCNLLQRHFLRSTRQSPKATDRPLSKLDFEYFHHRFFARQSTLFIAIYLQIKQPLLLIFSTSFGNGLEKLYGLLDFTKQLKNFGQWVCKLHGHRHCCYLGILYGFMRRDKIESSLEGNDPGTFIVRFSEKYVLYVLL